MKQTFACVVVMALLIPLVTMVFGQTGGASAAPPNEPLLVGTTCRISHPNAEASVTYEVQAYAARGWMKVVRVGDDEPGFWLNLRHATALFPVDAE